ncbi:conserved Plasmodium protein, unknown function [Plasmodium gallinaceum]|uniref:Uncharacterized protein n=1 Tax=Plasmodium gallinaceum TaxID=5849 RepID=A0A1J1GMV1_PLAGA|nr:conserved Plasmodium protein, unknown function [Plasmodium gallinaceum]CRG93659.1 conserved Plasmodium protein, unknown function [Plasmodium gallinaceum]
MKSFHCFFYFCNLFLTSRKKTFYNLKVNKISNLRNIKIYNSNDNYNYLEKSRNCEYEEILDEIINEYEEEKKKKEENNKEVDKKTTNLHENLNNNVKKDCDSDNKEYKKRDEIIRIEQQKKNNILNLCNLNYDLLNILLKKQLEENKIDDEKDNNYNKISLFLEVQAKTRNKKVYIDDSIGRYFLNIDDNFINTISERELHVLKNEIYKNIIYLKYKYLKSYKSTIHDLKKIKEKKTEEINKHVSLVHEDDNCEEKVNKNDDSNYTEYNSNESRISKNIDDENNSYTNKINKVSLNDVNSDHDNLNNLEENNYNLEKLDKELSIESIKEIIDVKQRLSILNKNFDNLKNLNIANILNKNNFLNDLKIHNFNFHNYNCSLLSKSMKNFVKKIHRNDISEDNKIKNNNEINAINKNEKNNSFSKEEESDIIKNIENNFSYICIPKLNDHNFFKRKSKSIIINLSNQIDDENKNLPKINELNVDTNKGVLILSGNEKNLNISVRNICDKISYLSQSFTIYPHINYNENFSKNKMIIIRILMLMLFYFNIKNLYVICLDNKSTKFFYEFMNNNDDNLLLNFCKNKKEEFLFANLNKIKFSHVFNRNFVPLFSINNIFKNHVFMMNKEENIFDINFFKRSCLFIFLDECNNKKNHVISTSVQHFFYYKKFDYPFIYNIDKNYSLQTLEKFNEILLYITTWIDIFHTSEDDNDIKNDEELTDGDIEHNEGDDEDDEDENSEILNNNNGEKDDENNDENNDERESYFGENIDNNKENEDY